MLSAEKWDETNIPFVIDKQKMINASYMEIVHFKW